jgi:hypothetical protein
MTLRCMGEWRYSSVILDLGTRWRLPHPLYPRAHWIGGCVGCRAGLNAVEKRDISCSCWELNPSHPVCCLMQLNESQLMFHRNMLPLSSGLKSKPKKNPAWSSLCSLLHAHVFLCLLFNLKDGVACSSEMSVDFQQTTTALCPRRENSS